MLRITAVFFCVIASVPIFSGTSTAATPTSVQFTTATTDSIEITWTLESSGQIPLYALSTVENFSTTIASATGAVGQENILIQSLLKNTTYYFKVKVSTENDSTYTSTIALATLAAPPGAAPSVVLSSGDIIVSWTHDGNATDTEYSGELYEDPAFLTQLAVLPFQTGSSFTATDLDPNTTFYFRVRAQNRQGIVTGYRILPAALTHSSPAAASQPTNVFGARMTANWITDLSANTQYKAELSTVANFTGSNDQTTAFIAGANSNEFVGLLLGTQYFTRVKSRGFNLVESVYTTLPTTTTQVFLETPPPSNVLSSSATTTTLGYSWTMQNSNEAPLIALADNFDFTSLVSSLTAGVNQSSHQFTGLAINNTYWFKIKVSTANDFFYTVKIETATHAADPIASLTTVLSSADINVSWTANGNPPDTLYDVSIFDDDTYQNSLGKSGFTTVLNSTIPTLTPATTFYFHVQAFNRLLTPTTAVILTEAMTFAEPPTASQPQDVLDTKFRTHWNPGLNPPGVLFRAQLSTATNFTGSLDLTSGFVPDISSFTFSGLALGKTYYTRVQARNAAGQTTGFVNLPSTETLNQPAALPPTNIVAGTATLTAIDLDWKLGSPGQTPLFAISESSDFVTTVSSITGGIGQEIVSLGGLNANTTYYFKIKVSTVNDIFYSATLTTATLAAAPLSAAPVVISTSEIQANWTHGVNPTDTQYSGEYARIADFTSLDGSSDFSEGTSLNVPGLKSNTTYYFRIRARNRFEIQTTTTILPTAVTLAEDATAALLIDIFNTNFKLEWSTGTNPIGTEFFAETSTATDFSGSADINSSWLPNISSFTFVGLTPDTTYYAHVKSRNVAAVETAFTTTLSTLTTTIENIPAPTNILAGDVSTATLRINWTLGSPGQAPLYAFSTNSNFTTTFSSETGTVGQNTKTVLGLTPNATYYFKIKVSTANDFLFSPTFSTATHAQVPVSSPTLVTSSGSLLGQWGVDQNPPGTEYSGEISDTSNFASILAESPFGTDTFVSITNLNANTTFYLRVRSRNWNGVESSTIALPTAVTLAARPTSGLPTDVLDTRLSAHWNVGSNPVGTEFSVEIASDPTFTDDFQASAFQADMTSFTFLNLSLDTTYYTRVRGRNHAGVPSSYFSLVSTKTLPFEAVLPPINIQIATITTTDLGYSWTLLSAAQSPFYVFGEDPLYAVTVTSESGGVNQSSHVVSGLSINTSYFFQVKVATAPDFFYSITFETATHANPPTSQPSVVLSSANIQVDWNVNGNPPGTQFLAELSFNAGFGGIASASPWTGASQFIAPGLTPNTTYYIRVRGRNSSNVHTATVPLNAQCTFADVIAPSLAPAPGPTQMGLTWVRAANPLGTEFKSEIDDDPAFGTPDATTWLTGTATTFFNLTPNTTYYSRVRARNCQNVETANIILATTATSAAIPSADTASGITISTIVANWGSNGNSAGTVYSAEIASENTFVVNYASIPFAAVFASTFTGLAANTTYYIRVRARNWAGLETATQLLAQESTDAEGPGSQSPTVVTNDQVTLNWSAGGNPAGTFFQTERSTDSNFNGTLFASPFLTSTSHAFGSLIGGTTYYFRVKARSHNGNDTAWVALPSTMTLPSPPTSQIPQNVFGSRLRAHWGVLTNAIGSQFFAALSTGTNYTGSLDQNTGWVTDLSSNTFLSLTLDTTYYTRVKARNAKLEESSFTNLPSTLTLNFLETLPPTSVSIDTVTTTSLDASWILENPTMAAHYKFSTLLNFSTIASSETLGVAVSSISLSPIAPNTTFYFKIKISTADDLFFSDVLSTATAVLDPGVLTPVTLSSADVAALWEHTGNPAGTEFLAERATNPGFSTGLANGGWTTLNGSTFTSLTPNTTYYLRVRSRGHNSAVKPPVVLGSTITRAEVPSSPTSTLLSSAGIFVSYSTGSNSGPTEFLIEISSVAGFTPLTATAGWATIRESTFTGLIPNTLYYARAQARNAAKEVTAFATVPSTRTFAQPPSALGPVPVFGRTLTVNWLGGNNPSGTEFFAEVSTATGFTGSLDQDSAWITSLSHTFTGLALNTTYYSRVRARNGDFVATPFTALFSTMTLPFEDTLPPNNILYSTASPTSVDVSWSLLVAFQAPFYALSTDPDFTTTASSQAGIPGQESVSIGGLTVNTTYYFKVKVSTAQDLFYSMAIATATEAVTPIVGPGVTLSSSNISLTWGGSANPAGTEFLAEAAVNSGFSAGLASGPWSAGFSSTFSALSVNTTYYLRVRARNHYGHPTPADVAAPIATDAEPPTAGAPTSITSATFAANWGAASNPAGTLFLVERATDTAFGGALVNSGWSTALASTFTALIPNTTHFLRVRARSNNGNQTANTSLPTVLTLAEPPASAPFTNVFDIQLTAHWGLGANPSGTEFFTELSSAADYSGSADQNTGWAANLSSNTFFGLAKATTYYLRTKARNAAFIETSFVPIGSTVTLTFDALLPPTQIVFTTATTTTLDATWTLENASQSPLFALSSVDDFATTISSLTGSVAQSSATFNALAINTTYYFKIKVSTAIDLFYSSPISTATLAAVPISSPSVIISSVSLAAHWLLGANPTGTQFLAEAALDTLFSSGLSSNAWTSNLVSSFTALSVNATYYLRVGARNWSGIKTATVSLPTRATNAGLPGTGTPVVLSSNDARGEWTAGVNPAGTLFQASLSTDSAFSPASTAAWTPLTNSTFTGLSVNTTYYWRVLARSHNGSQTANVSLTTTPTLADIPVAGTPAAISSTNVRADWNSGNNPAGTEFRAELATDSLFTTNTASASWTILTDSTFTALTPNTTYYTRVRARNHAGVETSTVALTEVPTNAAIPISLTPVILSTADFSLSWTANNNPAGTLFLAEMGTDPDISAGVQTSGWINATFTTFTALSPNTTFYARVRARNHAGVVTTTDAVRTAVSAAKDPVSIDPVVLSSADISARWDTDGNPSNTEFFAEAALNSGFSVGLMNNGWLTGSASTFTTLTPNTSYYLRVKARSHAGVETGFTTLPTTMTFSDPPTSQPLTRVFGSKLTTHWGSASNPPGTRFSAEVSTATDFTGSNDQTTAFIAELSYTFVGLILDTTYYSRVRAENLRGALSAYTALPTTTTLASETLPPTNISFDTATATSLDASWILDNPTQTPFYALDVSSAFAAPASSVTGSVGQSSASIGGLIPNTTYWFVIKVSTALDIFYSIPLASPTLAAAPTSGASGAVSDGSILAVWNANANPAGTEFFAERALDAAFTASPTNSGWITNTSFIFSPLSANTTQYIRVRARNLNRVETSTVSLGAVVTLAKLPSAPASVGLSSADVFVSWSTGTNPTGTQFLVEISTHAGFATLADFAGWTDFRESTFTGRTPNTLHYSRVKARNAVNIETSFVAIPSTWTFAEQPSTGAPTNILGEAITTTWGIGGNPAGTEFFVEISTAVSFLGNADQNSGWVTTSSHTFNGLILATTYYSRVKARNGVLQETAFTILAATLTLQSQSALPPTNIQFTTASVVSLDLSWNMRNPTEAPLYALSLFPNFITTISSQTGTLGQENVTLTGLGANTTYYFKIKVSTSQDQFYSSVISTATQAKDPGAPAAVAISSNDLQLDWNANGNPAATEFLAEAALDSGFTVGLTSGPWAAGTSSTFTSLSVNTTYFTRVRARNHNHHHTDLVSASAAATLAEPPSTSAIVFASTWITVNWILGANPAGTEFRAEASTDAVFAAAFSQSGWVTGFSETFTSLIPNTTYYLRLRARSHSGTATTASQFPNVHTLAFTPGSLSPDRKFATRITNQWLRLSNPLVTEFFTEISTAADYSGAADQNSNWVANSSHTFTGLIVNTTYYSRVKARNGLGVETAITMLPTTTTLLTETLPPDGIRFDTATVSTLDVSWQLDNPTQTPFYALSLVSNFATTISSTIGALAQSSASIGGLSLNTTYWFTIKVSTAIDLFYSNPIATPTLAGVAASSPSVTLTSTSLQAHWLINGNPGGTEFLAEAALDPSYTSGVASGTWATPLVSTFTALSVNATYYLRVRARNWAGIETSTLTLPETVTHAALPSTAATAALSTGSLAATWTANSNPAGTLYIAETSTSAAYDTLATTGWNAVASATFTALLPNATYYLRVRARNHAGVETVNVNFDPRATDARDPLTGTPVTLSSADLRAVWGADTNPASTHYFSQISLDAAFTTGLASAGWVTGTTSTFSALVPNTSYYLRVKARSHGGVESGYTTLPTTMTFARPPASLIGEQVFATQLTARWDVLNNPVGTEFLAQLSTAANFSGTLLPSGWTTNSSHTFTGLSNTTTYYSRVQARNAHLAVSAFTSLPTTVTLTAEALPPTNILFATSTSTTLDVSWTLDNASQAAFFALGISSNFAAPISSATGNVNQSTASFGALTANTTYWFRIKVSTASDLFYSVPIATMTRASAPLAGTPVALSSVALRAGWTANGNPAGTQFLPEAALNTVFTVGVVSGTWTTGLTQDFSGLSSNATYYLRVRGRNGHHIETATTTLTATATHAGAPGSAAASQQSSTTVRVNWTANGNLSPTSYVAEIATSAAFASLTASSTTFETFADFAGLDTSKLYFSRVLAIGHGGTNSVNTSLPDAVTLATAPTGGSIISVFGQSVTLDWNVNGNNVGTEFQLEHSTAANFTGTLVKSLWITQSSHTFAALQAVTTYYFRVKARNPGLVETNFLVLPSTLTLTPPNAPTAVAFTNATIASLDLAWTHGNLGITPLYALSTRDDFATTVSSQTGVVNQETVTLSGLSANTTYYFKVKFSTETDDGYSFPIATATLAAVPSAPSQTAVTTHSVSASWSGGSNGPNTVYIWELDDDPGFGSVDASSSTLTTAATIAGLFGNTRYFGRVRAVNHQGNPSENSSLGAFATLARAPIAVASPFVTVTFTSVTVQWTAFPSSPSSTSAQGFVVEASTASDFSGTISSNSILALTDRLALAGLADLPTLFFRIGSLNPDLTPNYLSLGSTLPLTAATTGQMFMNAEPFSVTLAPSDPEILSVTVNIPSNSLPEGTTVAINTGVAFFLPPPISNQMSLTPLGGVGIEIDTGGVQPVNPVTITMIYDPAALPSGKNPRSLIMARYDVASAQWTLMPTTVDTIARSVTGITDHFSLFAPFFATASTAFDAIQIFPVPWEPGANTQFDAQVLTFSNLPGGTEVEIYSILGERLRRMTAPPNGIVQWDGRNGSGTRAASGTYLVLFKKDGDRTTRRVVVIR
ncbi:MAG: hypothetical protein COB53_00635 [Elusimicrobia bacterium]|nr:MAG: hypothetical protein COB53_00635 [Elusimicrobiota bacterium]